MISLLSDKQAAVCMDYNSSRRSHYSKYNRPALAAGRPAGFRGLRLFLLIHKTDKASSRSRSATASRSGPRISRSRSSVFGHRKDRDFADSVHRSSVTGRTEDRDFADSFAVSGNDDGGPRLS